MDYGHCGKGTGKAKDEVQEAREMKPLILKVGDKEYEVYIESMEQFDANTSSQTMTIRIQGFDLENLLEEMML